MNGLLELFKKELEERSEQIIFCQKIHCPNCKAFLCNSKLTPEKIEKRIEKMQKKKKKRNLNPYKERECLRFFQANQKEQRFTCLHCKKNFKISISIKTKET